MLDLMLNVHLMNYVHKYLSARDIIVFYTTSIHIIKTSHFPLHEGLLLYEYPFLQYKDEIWDFSTRYNLYNFLKHEILHYHDIINNCPHDTEFEHSIFIYASLKILCFDDIIAYLGTITNKLKKLNMQLYLWPISFCFDTTWEVDYAIFSSYDNFAKPYFYVKTYDKLFDFENYDDDELDESLYIISRKKSLKILTGKIIRWDYPDLLRFADSDKGHLIKPFKRCKIASNDYIHKSNCKSHQICEMLNWQKRQK